MKIIKNCLEETQLENKIKHPEKIKLAYIVLKKVIKNSEQRFKNENHNVFTEEIDKIASSSNDD